MTRESRLERRIADLLEQHKANKDRLRVALVACQAAVADLDFPLRWPVRGWGRADVLAYLGSLAPAGHNEPSIGELLELAAQKAEDENG